MVFVVVVCVLAALIVAVLSELRRPGSVLSGLWNGPASAPPYRKAAFLLTRAERAFYEVLLQCVGQEWVVMIKVRLLDLLWLPRGVENRQAHKNRVQSKHVDFVLCRRDTVTPELVIELNDRSHDSPARQRRDAFVADILKAAGLPLLSVRARRAYDTGDLSRRISAAVGETSANRPAPPLCSRVSPPPLPPPGPETGRSSGHASANRTPFGCPGSCEAGSGRLSSDAWKGSGSDGYDKLTTSKLAKTLDMKTGDLTRRLLAAGLLERDSDGHKLTKSGEQAGGEARVSKRYGVYFLWPRDIKV